MSRHMLLGPADVSDESLAGMVARLLGHDAVEIVDSTAETVDYTVPSLTTVGRYWVAGTARTPQGDERFRLFVKHIRAAHWSPVFERIPQHLRDFVATAFPWRIEAAVYRSDLAAHLPEGLSMPRAIGVFELDPDSVAIWMEAVPVRSAVWDPARYERAAYLLGRLAADPGVRERGDIGDFPWDVMSYVNGRLLLDVIPQVAGDDTWQQPQVREAFGDLRNRMREACDRATDHGRELLALPHLASHGDASPGNLLAGRGPDEIVLIDFGLWLSKPVGFDLGQLIAGEMQLGRLPVCSLATLDDSCVAAYTRGLADEGVDIDLDTVRRAHALQLFLFSGVSALSDRPISAGHLAARALLARHSLDILDRTT